MPGSSVFSLITLTQALTDLSNKIASTAWVKNLGSSTPINSVSSASYNSTGYEDIWCNTASTGITVTLPASPVVGMKVGVTRSGTNSVIIANNGKTINSVNDSVTIDKDKSGLWFIWNPTATTWVVESRIRA